MRTCVLIVLPSFKQGEPICDYFEVELYEEGRTLVCIADGCSWGEPPRQAARKATDAYMTYLRENQRSITDLRDAGRLILRAFQKAHIKILEGSLRKPRFSSPPRPPEENVALLFGYVIPTYVRACRLDGQDMMTCGLRAPPPCAVGL
jgi:hypothetical protein